MDTKIYNKLAELNMTDVIDEILRLERSERELSKQLADSAQYKAIVMQMKEALRDAEDK